MDTMPINIDLMPLEEIKKNKKFEAKEQAIKRIKDCFLVNCS